MVQGVWTRLALAAVLACGASGAAQAAFTITGVVRNEAGVGLSNVDLDFIDACSGDSVFLVNDKTAADGSYSIVVNAGTYDIHYTPPAGSTVAGTERKDYVVAANANLGTTTLHPGFLVSGTVRNSSGAGIAGVDLKFVVVATGDKAYFTKDTTSVTGTYSVRVEPGTYDLEFRPPGSTTYVAKRRLNLVVTGNVSGLVDTLATGFNVIGTVTTNSGAAVKNVDLNFYDSCTGEKIPTANDNTDALGKYSIYVPSGTYSVLYSPPRCQPLAAGHQSNVRIDRNSDLKQTKLADGLVVSGRVLDNVAAALPGAKIKFFASNNGQRQYAAFDNTDGAGNYSIRVPAGTYNLNVEPPDARDLLVQRVLNVAVSGPTAVADVTLPAGVPVTGLVRNPSNAPVQNVNINAVDSVTRAAQRLAHDNSAVDGTFRVDVAAGTYDFQYSPPACSGLAPDSQRDVAVAGPTALATMNLVAGVHALGLVTNSAAAPVDLADLDFFPTSTGLKSYTPGDTTDVAGNYDVVVKPDLYNIDYVPPAGSALRPVHTFNNNLLTTSTLPAVVLPSGFLLSGVTRSQATSLPVANARVSLNPPGSGTVQWTPHNDTDVNGFYNFAVDAGTWDLFYEPPAGSGLAPRWSRGVAVTGPTSRPDVFFLPLTVPVVSGITPTSGTTAGRTSVTISGSGFQPDAVVAIGGVSASAVNVVSSSSITALTGPHPAGVFAVTVTNPGNQAGTRNAAFTYVEPATPVRIRLGKSGNNIVITWTSTGQPTYTVFRNPSPTGFTDASIIGTTATTTFTDVGGVTRPGVQYYQVN